MNTEFIFVFKNPSELHRLSLAKNAAAFFSILFSILSCLIPLRSLAISSAAGVMTGTLGFSGLPCSLKTQSLIVTVDTPRSLPALEYEYPYSVINLIASTLNSFK